MRQTQEKAIQTLLHKGNTKYLKKITDQANSVLGPDNYSPMWYKELGSQDPKQPLHKGPGPRPLPVLPSIFLVLEKELFYSQYIRPLGEVPKA